MSQQTVAILALIALLLPTGGAILARLIGRRFGNRATQIVGALSFAIALGSAVALYGAEIDRVALGPLAVFVPARGPLIESEAFSLRRAATDAPTAVEVAELEPSVEAPTPAQPQTSTAPSPTTASTTSATTMPAASATTRPTGIATASPTPTTAPATQTVQVAVEPTATPTVQPAVQPTARPPNRPATEPRAYFVEEGDTLRSIAERFDLSIEALLRYNGLSRVEGDRLQVGQKLFIPPR